MNKKYLSFLVPLFLCSLFLAIFAACGGNEKVYYSVNYFCEKGGSIQGVARQRVESGLDASEITALASEGYEFIGWDDGISEPSRTDKEISEDKTYVAKFRQYIFTVKYTSTTGGRIQGESLQKVNLNEDASGVTAISDEDYYFTGWSDGLSNATRTDTGVVGDITVIARFAKKCFLTLTSNISGASDLVSGTVHKMLPGESVSVTLKPKFGYNFLGWSDGNKSKTRVFKFDTSDINAEALFEYDSKGLPVMAVYTENSAEITNKETYVNCTVSITNDSAYSLDGAVAGIRLRGNSTMQYPKKPYRIKFDKKQGLFGWEKNKSWVLLALYLDFSNIKDYTAFAIADSIKGVGEGNAAFAPNAKHIEVYLNGDYAGLYLLCDQVQENSGRVDVESDFTEADTEVPFLVEMDDYAPYEGVEDVDYFKIVNTNITNYFNVKYPDVEKRFNQAQYDYIKNYIITVDKLCRNQSVTRTRFEQYIDLPSFIDYFLVQELMGQQEINKKSVYMSRKTGGKLVMGPVWDFDWSAGGPMTGNGAQHEPNRQIYSSNNWFAAMLKVGWFKTAVLNRLDEIEGALKITLSELAAYKNVIKAAAERNASIWDFDMNNSLPSFSEYYDTVLNFITRRIELIPIFLQYIN